LPVISSQFCGGGGRKPVKHFGGKNSESQLSNCLILHSHLTSSWVSPPGAKLTGQKPISHSGMENPSVTPSSGGGSPFRNCMVPVSLPLQEVRHEAAEARPVVRLGRHPYRSIGRCGGQQTVAAAAGEATRKHSKNGQKTSSMQRSNLMYNLIQ